MARNRKSQSVAIRFGPAIKALVICLLLGGSGVGYVWQKEQIVRLGQQIKAREVRLSASEDKNDKLRKELGRMCSPPVLEARIRELNLGLVPQQQAQVWRFPEPLAEAPAAPAGQTYPLGASRPLAGP
ncbi:MAG TPA: hypothetical protein VJA21_19730 [Verrucomicrobiae bacterium]